jgi:hypothetical protein
VPGIDEDCMSNSVEDLALPDCTFQDQLCLATGALTELDSEVVQVIDGRPGRPACSGEGAELCAGVVVAAAAATEPRSEPSDTRTEPTEETEPPTEPTPSEDTEPSTAPTREDEDAEPSGTGS